MWNPLEVILSLPLSSKFSIANLVTSGWCSILSFMTEISSLRSCCQKERQAYRLDKLCNKEIHLWKKRSRRGKSEKAIHFFHSLFLSLFHLPVYQSLLFPVALVFLILRWCFLWTSRSFLLNEWNEKEKKEHKSMRNRNRNEMESSVQTQRISCITFSTCKPFRELEQGRPRWQREHQVNIAFPHIFLFVMLKKSNVKTYNFYTFFFEQFKKRATFFFLVFLSLRKK